MVGTRPADNGIGLVLTLWLFDWGHFDDFKFDNLGLHARLGRPQMWLIKMS